MKGTALQARDGKQRLGQCSDSGAHAERRRLRCRSGWPKALLDRDPLDAGHPTSPTSNESVDAVDGRDPGPRSNSENRDASPRYICIGK